MAFFSFLDPVLNFLFGWLLNLSYFWGILILSLILSLMISLVYKYTTNQSLMKDLKTEIKSLQKEMKELRNEPQKMMQIQKKAMETNMKYMMHSMRSMLFTFIPIIIIFGWMNLHFAYYPIMPGDNFTTVVSTGQINGTMRIVAPEGIGILGNAEQKIEDGKVSWNLKAVEEGKYTLEYWHGDESFAKDVLVTTKKAYEAPAKILKRKDIVSITVNHQPVKVINLYIKGWKLGWIGTYIIFSIIFSMLIRKWLKIY